ncbi:hypothetical protein LY625_10550 [Lysobacter sp. GX 14042]|uniref:hypothetical protein n=1 Tax=Lysobacter sp. GX 14042 TaxID=2907155 RepID=UPI001F1F1FA8|nr:hypothetical protein [Lysobacter sp. GX 14042]MCE7033047.1 hypothetical protein [Lysobacter sp. GX 14042]
MANNRNDQNRDQGQFGEGQQQGRQTRSQYEQGKQNVGQDQSRESGQRNMGRSLEEEEEE